MAGLNAPYGAQVLSDLSFFESTAITSLKSLNAPYGARCFLTDKALQLLVLKTDDVLMHLMALGAF